MAERKLHRREVESMVFGDVWSIRTGLDPEVVRRIIESTFMSLARRGLKVEEELQRIEDQKEVDRLLALAAEKVLGEGVEVIPERIAEGDGIEKTGVEVPLGASPAEIGMNTMEELRSPEANKPMEIVSPVSEIPTADIVEDLQTTKTSLERGL